MRTCLIMTTIVSFCLSALYVFVHTKYEISFELNAKHLKNGSNTTALNIKIPFYFDECKSLHIFI